MTALDPRINPYRADLAAKRLRGQVSAARFVSGTQKAVLKGSTPLRRAPAIIAALDSELLFGELVTVYEDRAGWAWLQAETDGYVGYTDSAGLGDPPGPATHSLAVLRSYVFPEPDLKKPPLDLLSMGASVAVVGEDGAYSRIASGGWVYSRHLAKFDNVEADHAEIALRFTGTPYLWGGKTSIGLDCSGLIQVALARCGQIVPRDTDMQEAAIGAAVAYTGDASVLRRGDLVFWPGHAGIWIDTDRFVHANATDMMVAVAPLSDVAAYIADATGDRISSVRRPSTQ
jgi:cell wall-associated NlpC family hydrolase